MRKILFVPCIFIAVSCSNTSNDQSVEELKVEIEKYKAERDSLHSLYTFVLNKYDSVMIVNRENEKKMIKMNEELAGQKK
jgi:thiamine biosynthesis lipoprotein ApbE